MLSQAALFTFLDNSAIRSPNKTAVVEPGYGEISYENLAALSNSLRDRLANMGVVHGDRIGVYLHKSIDSVATIFGILKAGAAYVPVDPTAPVSRNAYILRDCSVKVVVLEEQFVTPLLEELGHPASVPFKLVSIPGTGAGLPLKSTLEKMGASDPAEEVEPPQVTPKDLAYILYTSGSTGKPKGVMLTHRAAISFVDWCSYAFEPRSSDRFSSHAPFHFDLSILDIYVPLKHGATLVLVSEATGKDPGKLAKLISDTKITSWYSTPSILSFLTQYGKMELYDYSNLNTIHFAGEVFPIKHLRALKEVLPKPRYFNLYGPTETNVCTYHQIPEEIPEDQIQPFPIGEACSHYKIRVVDENGNDVPLGEEGELVANGDGVMDGYWNLPERTENAFFVDSIGSRWYRTGDIVIEEEGGIYTYISRRDRMVKKRGYRVELGEIEVGLYRHPQVSEAAVVAISDTDDGVQIKAFLSTKGEKKPSLIELKKFCLDNLPNYMIPDQFSFLEVLPKTSTDKIDYQSLKKTA
jgi:amino acid adenylation domain-containing protein